MTPSLKKLEIYIQKYINALLMYIILVDACNHASTIVCVHIYIYMLHYSSSESALFSYCNLTAVLNVHCIYYLAHNQQLFHLLQYRLVDYWIYGDR